MSLAALFGSGCLNASRYSTPRTTPVGEVQHSLSGELMSFRGVEPGAYRRAAAQSSFYAPTDSGIATQNLPTLPSYGLRIGLTERLDLGLRLPSFAAFDVDLKWNFARSDALDAAIEPGFAVSYPDAAHVLLTSPFVVGVNPSPDFSIVTAFGLAYSSDAGGSVRSNSVTRLSAIEAGYLQAGLGLDFRFEDFGMHPEMTVLRSFTAKGDVELTFMTFGVGFNWGSRPSYGSREPGEP